jgi:prepilin-type N-terminal cleavage/methylation domain-containing protein
MSGQRKTIGGAGFTLIELMVVLAIISITAAAVIPRVGSSWKRMEDREFLQQFVETLKRARLVAMNSGQVVAFRINGAEIYSERLEKDPATGDFLMFFYPDGSMVGNDVEVTFDQQRVFRLHINPLFGEVMVAKAEGR